MDNMSVNFIFIDIILSYINAVCLDHAQLFIYICNNNNIMFLFQTNVHIQYTSTNV